MSGASEKPASVEAVEGEDILKQKAQKKYKTIFEDSFSEEIWASTYKDYNDKDINDTLYRVAKAIASAEETEELKEKWTLNYYDMLSEFKVIPGGRVLSNAGTAWGGTTLHNCFVAPRSHQDIDSLDGILVNLRNQSQTLKSEGGWGENFSYIRPRGAFIKGIGVETPGAIKYMELFDKSSEIITSGSGRKSTNKKAKNKIRKGAQMAVLDCWHPDIIEFVTAKQQPGRLTKFNVSVNCTDEFMNKLLAVIEMKRQNASESEIVEVDKWELRFPDTTHKQYKKEWDGNLRKWEDKNYPVIVYNTISVSWLWNLIMESTFSRAEPGVLFLDRANDLNPLSYNETIVSTNPCITGDTLVAVADGRHQVTIQELAESGIDVPVFTLDNKNKVTIRTMRHPRITGYNQPVYEVVLDDGTKIKCTKNHKFKLLSGEYVETCNLKPNDSLFVMTKYHAAFEDIFPSSNSSPQDYMWINSSQKGNVAEHRLIAEHYNSIIPTGSVVHHMDFNSLNNFPQNLKIMTKEDHDHYHGSLMVGDNNPMRKAKKTWTQEQWNNYRGVSSPMYNTVGESNSRYSGVTNEEYFQHAVNVCKSINRRFSIPEWDAYCIKNNLPRLNSNFRLFPFVTHSAFSVAAAEKAGCNQDQLVLDPRKQKTYQSLSTQGYHCVVVDNEIHVEKCCEICGAHFTIHHLRREGSLCSPTCIGEYARRRVILNTKEYQQNSKDKLLEIKAERKLQQAKIYNDLAFNLKRIPLKKEWQEECKHQGIACLVGRHSPFVTFDGLGEFASMLNHRVVSITPIGHEHVYNGTVDDFHNFFVGGQQGKTKNGKKKWTYINNLQCGEQVLSPGNICCLGTLNLTQFINDTQTDFDYKKLQKYVRYLVRFLDNVNTVSQAPLPEYKQSMVEKRRIGCGVMGWGSSLYVLQVPFASTRANTLRDAVMETIAHTAYEASADLAEEKGMFVKCIPDLHADGKFIKQINLPSRIIEKIRKTGIRNSSLLSCQPNGNTSILANVVTGGIEPVFLPEYVRTVVVAVPPDHIIDVTPKWYEGEWRETEMFKKSKEGDEEILKGVDASGTVYKIDKNRGLTKEVLCEDFGVRSLKRKNKWNINADWASTTTSLTAQQHVDDLKGFAKYVDSALSKTINLPNNYTFEHFKNIYLDAYNTGYIKGLTTYRAGTMTTVLAAKDEKTVDVIDEEIIKEDVKLPDSSPAVMKTLRAEGRKYYVTVVYYENKADRPFALFVKSNHHESSTATSDAVDQLLKLARKKKIPRKHIEDVQVKIDADNNANKVARVLSLLLRHGVLIKNIVAALDNVDGVFVGSFIFQIKKFLSAYIKDGDVVEDEKCLECGGQLVFQEGCRHCQNCGGSKCG